MDLLPLLMAYYVLTLMMRIDFWGSSFTGRWHWRYLPRLIYTIVKREGSIWRILFVVILAHNSHKPISYQ